MSKFDDEVYLMELVGYLKDDIFKILKKLRDYNDRHPNRSFDIIAGAVASTCITLIHNIIPKDYYQHFLVRLAQGLAKQSRRKK